MSYGYYGGLNALDAIADAAPAMVPIGVGMASTFGATQAVAFFVKNPSVQKWKWALGGVAGVLMGAGVWAMRGDRDGAVAMATSVATALAGYGTERLAKYRLEHPTAGLGRFVMSPAQPLYAGMGRYVLSPAQELYAGMGQTDPNVDHEILDFPGGTTMPAVSPEIVQFQAQQNLSPALMV